MATRPVFVPLVPARRVAERPVEFVWVPGMARTQIQKCIRSLHAAATERLRLDSLLEISTRSERGAGVALSAFNLMIPTTAGPVPVECVYQSSKLFERGGPFLDLLTATPREARADERLTASGQLVGFIHDSESWGLEPKTCFYDWLYVRALAAHPALAALVARTAGFTDIAFNPERSISCQARSAALYSVLFHTGDLAEAMSSQRTFIAAHCRAIDKRSVASDETLFARE
ncbi:MAG: DUF6977 family protein [Phycisphaerales bacterium]